MNEIVAVELIVGMEVHVELGTASKVFSRAVNLAGVGGQSGKAGEGGAHGGGGPNWAIDAVVLGLPGALPTVNVAAIELAMRVGLALGCAVSEMTSWDRKSYFYPDLPKGYQISQLGRPVCFGGRVEVEVEKRDERVSHVCDMSRSPAGGTPAPLTPEKRVIRIDRAHLEEDAGKLMHEAPGGGVIEGSIVDLNRAGTPLLEIVTAPDFRSAAECVEYARMLREVVRGVGASRAILQKGEMRFEPSINCALTLADGRVVRTPIVEVKNLNSFAALEGAIEYEREEQPRRWKVDGRAQSAGNKSTRGWDDGKRVTVAQREKEEAADYRYFPEPDLLPVALGSEWVARVRGALPELPNARRGRYATMGLGAGEIEVLAVERGVAELFEGAVEAAVSAGMEREKAVKGVANLLVQSGGKRVNEYLATQGAAGGRIEAEDLGDEDGGAGAVEYVISDLGISAEALGGIAALRGKGEISAANADELFGMMCGRPGATGAEVTEAAAARGMVMVRDEGAVREWVRGAIAEQGKAAEDVRAGKMQAVGRLVGAAMKLAGGKGDAGMVRKALLEELGVKVDGRN
ncbi:Asp-tRNA(Asn)/Glu-tRNA(Gln) amidotransferase subunit GatB [soil metagenome]